MPLQLARFKSWPHFLTRYLPIRGFRHHLVLAAIIASLAMTSGKASSQERDAKPTVVAVVNADPITRKTLADAATERYGSDVLDNMVNRHLIMQACQSSGIEVTKQQVTAEIQRLASKFGLSMDSYLKLLQEERDITPNQYSREIIWPMLALRRLVADQVEVTDAEFNKAYLSQFGEAVKCRLIMTASHGKATKVLAQAKANPGSFASLAKQFSEDEASMSVGGLIPPIRRYTGDSRLEEAAFALQDNQVSEILQLGDQWIILQAVRRIPEAHPSPQAMPAIKEQINDRIRDEKMRSAASELFAKLQQDAKVVKVIGNAELSQQYPGVAALINGQSLPISQVSEECLKRHGEDVLEGEINRKLLTQALRAAKKQVTDDDIRSEVLRAASNYGFVTADGSPDPIKWMESVTANSNVTETVYIADSVWPSVALMKLVEEEVALNQDDMREGYESAYGPRVEVLAIVLSDQRSAQKIWEMARDNPTDKFFGDLAQQYSVEPVSSSNMGKVPPIRKHSGQPAVEKEAFSLKPGELSGIIATGGKYIVLRCQGFTEPVVSDPAAVQEELVRDLTAKKTSMAMMDKMESIRDSAEIDNFLVAQKKAPRVAAKP
ncbi:Foldase protein PrsA 2 precursor [Rubripirellula obstinata]|uniref:peptidylprolyl isomerase n=1 Tax=Rubripirellula obstinata TaxID=406547 RepID=A0A5B1CRL8_9BACT|nr:peptidylprolyl isomerase [Rubripirellula obstinata]KAA1262280.1 Foldase protein PrsA 2 precursor [Rubripirellula obstinata]